ncbi:unnamed protein product [Schistosoma margrebowiei]|uniref:Uncharacterized protein n=1 Tax=Schistosoma margrebowiei TaxID=48269 RepID=A0A183MB30_9TREM|nr:unnamed protein product [Schistosoma margrebowiei]
MTEADPFFVISTGICLRLQPSIPRNRREGSIPNSIGSKSNGLLFDRYKCVKFCSLPGKVIRTKYMENK